MNSRKHITSKQKAGKRWLCFFGSITASKKKRYNLINSVKNITSKHKTGNYWQLLVVKVIKLNQINKAHNIQAQAWQERMLFFLGNYCQF